MSGRCCTREDTDFQVKRGNVTRNSEVENKKATTATISDIIKIVLVINLLESMRQFLVA